MKSRLEMEKEKNPSACQKARWTTRQWLPISLAICGALVSLWLRYSLRTHVTNDILCCLGTWYDYIKQDGHYAFINAFSNLAMPILYAWYLISLLFPDLSTLIAIKIPAVICDFILAFYFYKIVSIKTANPYVRLAAFLVPLFTPTVFLNSAWWGQFDSVYTAPILAGLYYLLKKREATACLFFGLAFSVKFQMAFILPFLLILLLCRFVNWKSFLLIPAVYLVSILPAWLQGRPLIDLLLIYARQAGQYERLSMNAPTVYNWISDKYFNPAYPIGIIVAALATFSFVFFAWRKFRSSPLETGDFLHLALISTLILPTLLPMMQGRYYYQAEILALALAFYIPRRFYWAVILQILALYTYGRYFFGYDVPGIGLKIGSIVLLALLVDIVLTCFHKKYTPPSPS